VGVGKQVNVVLQAHKLCHGAGGRGGEETGDKGADEGIDGKQGKDQHGGQQIDDPYRQAALGLQLSLLVCHRGSCVFVFHNAASLRDLGGEGLDVQGRPNQGALVLVEEVEVGGGEAHVEMLARVDHVLAGPPGGEQRVAHV